MGYIGQTPTAVPLSSADIAPGTIEASDLNSTLNLSSKTVTLPASSVTSHVTSFDDSNIRSDILKLAIHQATEGNRIEFGLSNSWIDGFETDDGLATQTTVDRDTTGEYVSTTVSGTTNATGTLISDTQTASSSRSSISGCFIYEDALPTASTLGTDLKIYFTANNGTNWTEASSYSTPVVYSGDKKLVTLGATTVTPGSAVAMKAVWANQSRVSGSSSKTITSFNSPVHSTTQAKVGTTSLDLTSTKGLETPDHADWTPSGDWTLEMWAWIESGTSAWSSVFTHVGTPTGISIGAHSGSIWGDTAKQTGGAYIPNIQVGYTAQTWFHIAYVLDGSTGRLYKDGVQVGTGATSGSIGNCTNSIKIGRANIGWTGEYSGYLDEIRFSHVCRYPNGTTFTSFGQDGGTISSPTPFTRDSDTKFLLQSNTTNGSTTFVDTPLADTGKQSYIHGWACNY
jgi:hypothetical protein